VEGFTPVVGKWEWRGLPPLWESGSGGVEGEWSRAERRRSARAERRRSAYALLLLRAETQRVCVVAAACDESAPSKKRCLFYFPALLRENKRETLLPCAQSADATRMRC
jgi:hypothetical protein